MKYKPFAWCQDILISLKMENPIISSLIFHCKAVTQEIKSLNYLLRPTDNKFVTQWQWKVTIVSDNETVKQLTQVFETLIVCLACCVQDWLMNTKIENETLILFSVYEICF